MGWSNPYYPQQSGAVPGQMEMYKQQYQTTQYPMPQANPIAQTAQSMMTPQSTIQWVQGEAAAKAWNVPPNASAVLWDTEAPLIYIKTADQMGMPSMRIIQWSEYRPQPPQSLSAGGEYAPISAIRDLEQKIEALQRRINEMRPMTEEGAQSGT